MCGVSIWAGVGLGTYPLAWVEAYIAILAPRGGRRMWIKTLHWAGSGHWTWTSKSHVAYLAVGFVGRVEARGGTDTFPGQLT